MNQWQFNPLEDKAISEVADGEIVFYIEDIAPDVICKIVTMHNEEYSIKKIENYLLGELKVTTDEREYLIEQIIAYEKTAVDKPIVVYEVSKQQAVVDMKPNKEEVDLGAVAGPIKPEQTDALNPKVDFEVKKERKPRKEKVSKIGVEDYKKLLLEKIDLLDYIDSIEVPDLPTELSKSARTILLDFQNEMDSTIEKYMDLIQKM